MGKNLYEAGFVALLLVVLSGSARAQNIDGRSPQQINLQLRWKDCLVDALAVYSGLRERPETIVEASLGRCRKEQEAAMNEIFAARAKAGFANTSAVINELTNTNIQQQRDWMLAAVLEMRISGLAPQSE
jgi:hypothetical protein